MPATVDVAAQTAGKTPNPSKSASYYYNNYYYRYYGGGDWGSGERGEHNGDSAGAHRLLKGRNGSRASVGFEPYRAD